MTTDTAGGKEGYPELLGSIEAAVTGVLVDAGIEIATAKEAGHAAAERVRRDLGGFQVYVPAGRDYELSVRDRAIYAEWNGRNEYDLCRKHGISERHMRRIIEARRAEDKARRQGNLSLDS